jgi:hypothetical protein
MAELYPVPEHFSASDYFHHKAHKVYRKNTHKIKGRIIAANNG